MAELADELTLVTNHPATETDVPTYVLDPSGFPLPTLQQIATLPPHYKIKEPLKGSDGRRVFLADNEQTHSPCVIKLSRQSYGLEPQEAEIARARYNQALHNEADIMRFLAGGPVTVVEDLMETVPCLVLKFTYGTNLSEYLKTQPATEETVTLLTTKLAQAVKYLHDRGIVHRDIKPANVLVPPPERTIDLDIILADFEAAQTTTSALHIECPFRMVGTPKYMSEEQLAGAPAHPTMDIYSLGMTFRDIYLRNRTLVTQQVITLFRAMTGSQQKRPTINEVIDALNNLKL